MDHTNGGKSPGQTRTKPKDLSGREREECGRGEGGVLYTVYMRERGGGRRGSCVLRKAISAVMHTEIRQFRRGRQRLPGCVAEPMHLCTCVSEEGGDGEAARSETPSLLSSTLRGRSGRDLLLF